MKEPRDRPRAWRAIHVTGHEPVVGEIVGRLGDLSLKIRRTPWSERAARALPTCRHVPFVVGPLPGDMPLRRGVELLRGAAQRAGNPVFVAVPDGTRPEEVSGLYTAGATAVFEWPREAPDLPDLVAARLGIAYAQGVATETDRELASTVRAHLRMAPHLSRDVGVSARGSVVTLWGSIDALWKRAELARLAGSVAGVERVVARHLWVEPSLLNDAHIEAAARAALTPELGGETIAVAVSHGIAVLAGTAEDRDAVGRVLDTVSRVAGVREIEDLLTISASTIEAERRRARRLQLTIAALVPHSDTAVATFGDTVVLTGSVPDEPARQTIVAVASANEATRRVIDKLDVIPPREPAEPE